MIPHKIDYLIESKYGNQIRITESELSETRILSRQDEEVIFLHRNVKYRADILSISESAKEMKIRINNQILYLNLKDQLDQLVDNLGLSNISEEQGGDIYSPMPGMVLQIMCEEGDEVKKGDPLLILEAMKMENLIQASSDGTVKAIKCTKLSTVNKGDLLVTISS